VVCAWTRQRVGTLEGRGASILGRARIRPWQTVASAVVAGGSFYLLCPLELRTRTVTASLAIAEWPKKRFDLASLATAGATRVLTSSVGGSSPARSFTSPRVGFPLFRSVVTF
jgi:hypothetical protein